MRASAIFLTAAMLVGSAAHADDAASVSPSEHRAIEQVIASQLDAFSRDAADG